MRRVFEVARTDDRRIVFAEGEDQRVLHAVQAMTEEVTARPILIGRPDVIESRCERNAIPLKVGRDFELVNPEDDPRYREYWGTYHAIMQRRGVTPDLARAIMRTNTTAIAATMVHRGEAESMICGTFGQYLWHLKYVQRGARQRRAASDRGAVADDPRAGRDLRRRHPGAPGADAAGDRRRDDRGGAARAPLRARAEGRALLALAVRQPRHRLRAADAGGAGDPRRAGARLRLRGRDAFRRGARSRAARAHLPERPLRGAGERADLRQHRRGERGRATSPRCSPAGSRSGRS